MIAFSEKTLQEIEEKRDYLAGEFGDDNAIESVCSGIVAGSAGIPVMAIYETWVGELATPESRLGIREALIKVVAMATLGLDRLDAEGSDIVA